MTLSKTLIGRPLLCSFAKAKASQFCPLLFYCLFFCLFIIFCRLKCPYFDPAQFHCQHLRVYAFRSQPVHVQHPEMSHLPGPGPGHYWGVLLMDSKAPDVVCWRQGITAPGLNCATAPYPDSDPLESSGSLPKDKEASANLICVSIGVYVCLFVYNYTFISK